MPDEILRITGRYQKDAQMIQIERKELTIPLVKQYYYEVQRQNKEEVVCRLLDYYNPKRSLIFCNTKHMADVLCENLKGRGYFADALHGDLSQMMRDKVMNSFRNGTTEILIATDVAARGLDVDDVEAVFNFDIPQDVEYYVHRIGRTGRAGRKGRSFTLVVGREIYRIRDIERICNTQIKPRMVPSVADITQAKASQIFDQVMEVISNNDLSSLQKKVEDKIAELKTFIARFSANKSKSKQATSRRKLLDNLTVEELPASSRRYPFIGFDMDRELGKEVLQVSGISKTVDGVKLLNNVSFTLGRTDKVAFIGESEQAITMLFKILMEEEQPDEGTFKWGVSTSTSYFPVDNSAYFNDNDDSILEWIRQYSTADETETFLRGFLGRMLFSGDDIYKPVKVLSGGEKVRCMFARMMLFHSNVLLLDRPTNHLDLESITAVNNGLVNFKGVVILSSHDHEILETVANRIIEITPEGCIDRQGTYEEYLAWKKENGK